VLEAECSLVIVATGASGRRDGVGRHHSFPLPGIDGAKIYTPDDIMGGAVPEGPVVVFDDDHYYMGGVIAEKLRMAGLPVTVVTPESIVSSFTQFTLEQAVIQKRLIKLGIEIMTAKTVVALHEGEVEAACVYTGRRERLTAASVVLVTSQTSEDGLYHALAAKPEALRDAGIRKVVRIGDCLAPGIIAAAVYSGHRAARELGVAPSDAVDFKRENVALAELAGEHRFELG
jgi:dimethylamine/trimethylamine dehydrogenase